MINRKAILVHGFNVRDNGAATINKIAPIFTDTVQYGSYGWFGITSVLTHNDNIANTIAGMALEGSVGLAHSNGCALLIRAARLNTKIKDLVFINPAIVVDVKIPEHINSVHVYHNSGDTPVKWARALNVIVPGDFLWGRMGNVGYKGDDPRVVNHDLSMIAQGHSAVFDESFTELNNILIKDLKEILE